MNLTFTHDKEKDVWCLLNKGKSSNNDSNPTKIYENLVAKCGENPTSEQVSTFIDTYISENNIVISDYIARYGEEWNAIADKYTARAEEIFGVKLPEGITAYLTINTRCPYSIEGNYFFVTVPRVSQVKKTIMHELWHFYTWYGLGVDQEERLGKAKYNELKEALTVLLNVEYKDLLSEGVIDNGYPQHAKLREEILELWEKDKNIKDLWQKLTQ